MAWTVQKLIDGGMAIHAYCQNSRCGHHRLVDLDKIKSKLGPDAPAMADDIAPALVCSKCTGKQIGLIYTPAGNEKMSPGRPPR